jgi:serine/threonine-protein kinase
VQSHPNAIGRYEVERLLGAGGMGAVYLARDPAIGRQVAIKVLRTDDEEYRRRFAFEIKAAGALRHRNIITIFDSGEHEGSPFLAMEYIPGETLADKINRREPLPLAEKLRYISELCDGLAHAHAAGIVHRDIKPANVIIDAQTNSLKIVDFGIARVGDATVTQTGLVVGTLSYMSPENVRGQRVDQRSDVYAVGLVLYELVCYRRAFPGSLDDGLMYRILYENPADLRTVHPHLDDAIITIVERSLNKNPEHRYADAGQMAEALRAARSGLPATPVEAAIRQSAVKAVTDAGGALREPTSRYPFGRVHFGKATLLAVAVVGAIQWLISRESVNIGVNQPVPANSPAPERATQQIQWIDIPAGSFSMGCVDGDPDCYDDERPKHSVAVGRIRVMASEVKTYDYETFASTTGNVVPAQPPESLKTGPLVNVTWDEARAFCAWAGGRLPTEAEWEYAARAGTSTRYWWGDAWDASRATGGASSLPIPGGLLAHRNPWGLYDTLGNVYEWTSTLYRDYPYAARDGREHPQLTGRRVLRGGSWSNSPGIIRASIRYPFDPTNRSESVGFRCVQ